VQGPPLSSELNPKIMQQMAQVVAHDYMKKERLRYLLFRTTLTVFLFGFTTSIIIHLTSSSVGCDGKFTLGEQLAKLLFFSSILTGFIGIIYSFSLLFFWPSKFKSIIYLLVFSGLCIASFYLFLSIEFSEGFCIAWIYGQGAY